jgi:hypothetical protein
MREVCMESAIMFQQAKVECRPKPNCYSNRQRRKARVKDGTYSAVVHRMHSPLVNAGKGTLAKPRHGVNTKDPICDQSHFVLCADVQKTFPRTRGWRRDGKLRRSAKGGADARKKTDSGGKQHAVRTHEKYELSHLAITFVSWSDGRGRHRRVPARDADSKARRSWPTGLGV